MAAQDFDRNYRFTSRQTLDRNIHTIEGIIKGISIDGKINEDEGRFLYDWLSENEKVAHFHPFNELIPCISDALQDGIIEESEKKDILWLCENLKTKNIYYDYVASDIQRLQAVLSGISADGIITKDELTGLRKWLTDHEYLSTCWPYDEVDSLLTSVLQDGKIDNNEHNQLLCFFKEFTAIADDRVLKNPQVTIGSTVTGVCAVCPDIQFRNKTFCFTGKSSRAKRQDISDIVTSFHARFTNTIGKSVDYLIIGASGNPAWAYACYGRKIEEAINIRKAGYPLLIVHEHDFWDAVVDHE